MTLLREASMIAISADRPPRTRGILDIMVGR